MLWTAPPNHIVFTVKYTNFGARPPARPGLRENKRGLRYGRLNEQKTVSRDARLSIDSLGVAVQVNAETE
jgi:hypothetical protein